MYVTVVFIFTFVITKICRRGREKHYDIPARDIRKGHRWCMTNIFSQPTYCNISGNHIIHGAFCDSCGVCVEDQNVKEANLKLPCKALSTTVEMHKHHWIRGNLPLFSNCCICQAECGHQPELCDYRCCWCARTVHENCKSKVVNGCDLGQYKEYIVPPNCVRLKQVGLKGRRHWVVASVMRPVLPKWSPLIVVANRKSGNGDGEHILQEFRRILNPAQVNVTCLILN